MPGSLRTCFALFLLAMIAGGGAAAADVETAAAKNLRARYAGMAAELAASPFKMPLVLKSEELPGRLKGEVYAVMDRPFSQLDSALSQPAQWCDVLILHLNVKYCRAGASAGQQRQLTLHIGRKQEQALKDSHPLVFDFARTGATADYFRVQLKAGEGPLSTKNMAIDVEAVAVNSAQTLLHFTYAYEYGVAGRLAMKGYLATIGHDKVGFTTTGRSAGGAPRYVAGVRGLTERNTMRYYLAVDAYLKANALPAAQRFEKSLDYWFAATEKYPRQLHEVERDAYISMKKKEYRRQRAAQ